MSESLAPTYATHIKEQSDCPREEALKKMIKIKSRQTYSIALKALLLFVKLNFGFIIPSQIITTIFQLTS